jgi:hypothetical protein
MEVETIVDYNIVVQNNTKVDNASFDNLSRTNEEQQLLVTSLKEEVLAEKALLRYEKELNWQIKLELDESKQRLASQEELYHFQQQKFDEKEQQLILENDQMVEASKLQLGKEKDELIEETNQQQLVIRNGLHNTIQKLKTQICSEKDTITLNTKLTEEKQVSEDLHVVICNLTNQIPYSNQLDENGIMHPCLLHKIGKDLASERRTNSNLCDLNKQLNDRIQNIDVVSLLDHNMATDEFLVLIQRVIEKFASRKNRKYETFACHIIKYLFDTKILDGHFKHAMIDIVRKKRYQKHVFSPEKILQLLDTNGGQLSYQGIDLLRQLETNGESYVCNTILPHSSTIIQVSKEVDKYAHSFIPFETGKLDDGYETIKFPPESVARLMIKGYKLESIAKQRHVCIDMSTDSQQITMRNSITSIGIKMVDPRYSDPRSGQYVWI